MTSSSNNTSRESLVKTTFGAEALTYLKNKHRGGVSGGKGTRYEDVFAVVQAAKHACRLNVACGAVSLEAQVPLYFIDDLVVREHGNAVEHCFQLKNSPSVTWGSGEKCIADDCIKQLMLSAAAGQPAPKVVLVTSDVECAASLQASVPSELSGRVEVRWFPWAERSNMMCKLWPTAVEAVAWLSKYEAPNFQQVSDVLTVLIGVWASQDGNIVVSALIEKARDLSPTLIRPLVADDVVQQALADEFKNALAAIDNFSYSITKGFFVWNCSFLNGSIQQGIFAQDCLSDSFKKFQDRVVKVQPMTFEEIEEELL
jgi:hypothetical protein